MFLVRGNQRARIATSAEKERHGLSGSRVSVPLPLSSPAFLRKSYHLPTKLGNATKVSTNVEFSPSLFGESVLRSWLETATRLSCCRLRDGEGHADLGRGQEAVKEGGRRCINEIFSSTDGKEPHYRSSAFAGPLPGPSSPSTLIFIQNHREVPLQTT